MSSIPTFQEMWSMYLFNSKEAPKGEALLNESLIRNNALIGEDYDQTETQSEPLRISVKEFMTQGAGKFVNGAVFSFVENFLVTEHLVKQNVGTLQEYDEMQPTGLTNEFIAKHSNKTADQDGNLKFNLKEIIALNEKYLGLSGENPTMQKSISQRQFFPDGESDYEFAQRVQLFESTNFQVGASVTTDNDNLNRIYDETVEFIIKADGTRFINNFVVTPKGMDNFDFTGGNGDGGQAAGNELNGFLSDPSDVLVSTPSQISGKTYGIGRTVPIEYVGHSEVGRKTYSIDDFYNDKSKLIRSNYIIKDSFLMSKRLVNVYLGSSQMYKEMYEQDIISFKDEQGRSVYYGTVSDDNFDLDNIYSKDLNWKLDYTLPSVPTSSPSSLIDIEEDRIDNFKNALNNKNKITFVAGSGNDVINGLDKAGGIIFADKAYNDDRIFGGSGNDTVYGHRGNDELHGEDGNDTLNGGEGNDTLYGGEGRDVLNGDNGFDTYFADNNDTISDSDGKGKVLLNNVQLVGGVQDLTGKNKNLYYSEDGSITYRWNKATKELTVNNGLVIKDFDNEELGINLVEAKGQDIAFVVDVSGSMGDNINAVVNQLDGLLNMIFSPKRGMMDSRISVVAYEEPITVLQKFTQHDTVAERKAAAKQAIAKLPNMIGGGTEYLYTALYTVLSGGAGQWRKDAQSRHIFLIGDEPGDDAHLAKQVYALAKNLNINANISARSTESGKFYDVRFQSRDSDDEMSVNIHPIMIGNNTQLSDAFNHIAQQTGGTVHQTQGASDIANVLYDALQSGTAGDDVQIGNEANNTLNGRVGNDKLFGYGGNDTLNGGVGNDVLDGGEGADKFVFSRYFGQDVVYSDELDTFVFHDISLKNLKFIQAANHDLLIQQQGTQNQVTVTGFFDGGSSFAVLQDDFGNTLSAKQVMEMAQHIAPIDKNQTITGNIFANQLFGGSGDDVIKGLLGNDILNGGLGNDRLEGGLGADTYVFKAGDGHDRLYDSGGNDTLRFEDVSLDHLWFSRDGKNLHIDVLDNGGSVTIENYFTSAKSTHFTTNAIEHFQTDGHHLFSSYVNKLLNVMEKFEPTEHVDWNVDMQRQHYLQNNHIEQYWQSIEQY